MQPTFNGSNIFGHLIFVPDLSSSKHGRLIKAHSTRSSSKWRNLRIIFLIFYEN